MLQLFRHLPSWGGPYRVPKRANAWHMRRASSARGVLMGGWNASYCSYGPRRPRGRVYHVVNDDHKLEDVIHRPVTCSLPISVSAATCHMKTRGLVTLVLLHLDSLEKTPFRPHLWTCLAPSRKNSALPSNSLVQATKATGKLRNSGEVCFMSSKPPQGHLNQLAALREPASLHPAANRAWSTCLRTKAS